MIGITVVIVRVTGCHPVIVPMGRVTVIPTDPDITPVIPLVMAGNPDSRTIRALPLMIIFPIRRRALRADMDAEGWIC